MTRQEIKELAIINFGFEDAATVAIYAIDEALPNDDEGAVEQMTAVFETRWERLMKGE